MTNTQLVILRLVPRTHFAAGLAEQWMLEPSPSMTDVGEAA